MPLKQEDFDKAIKRNNAIYNSLQQHNLNLADKEKFILNNLDWYLKKGIKQSAMFYT